MKYVTIDNETLGEFKYFKIKYLFPIINGFSIVYATYVGEGEKYFLLDSSGKPVELLNICPQTKPQLFDSLRRLSNDFICYEFIDTVPNGKDNFRMDTYKGILDLELNPIIEFSDLPNFYKKQFSPHNNIDSTFTDFDQWGNMVVRIGKLWGVINEKGNWLFEPCTINSEQVYKYLQYHRPDRKDVAKDKEN